MQNQNIPIAKKTTKNKKKKVTTATHKKPGVKKGAKRNWVA